MVIVTLGAAAALACGVAAVAVANCAVASARVVPSAVTPALIACFRCMSHPFPEGCLALWSEVVSWLSGLTAVPSQCLAGASGLDTAVLPGNSGGSAPDSHRLPITTDLGRLDA